MSENNWCKKIGGKFLAFVTWKINRFGNKEHNNSFLNREFFLQNRLEIKKIINFLEDEDSKNTYKKCIKYRVSHKIKDQPNYNKKNQYFPEDIVQLSEKEVFVDCGAYTGDSIKKFINVTDNQYKKIIAFEPSRKNSNKIVKIENLDIINAGVWSCNKILKFKEDGEGSKVILEEMQNSKTLQIRCKAIDLCRECSEVTFIKMDVEGAEFEGLKGAVNTIEKNRPILAICIYHFPEDFIRIPLYLYEKCKKYKFYVRHHSHRCAETVLYAIPIERCIKV